MQVQALPGFRDFYPEDTARRNQIFTVWREVARRFGFEEYDGPPLEDVELYVKKSGIEILQQLYDFRDKGERHIALRPEMTPTLARMVSARASAIKKPIRWFSIPQLFRYERQQKGRLKEHFQLNMDLIGEESPLADAEIIAAAIDIQVGLGLGPDSVRVRMSDRRVLKALLTAEGIPEDVHSSFYAAIDKLERVAPATAATAQHDLITAALKAHHLSEGLTEPVLAVARIRDLDSLKAALRRVDGGLDVGEQFLKCHQALVDMGLAAFLDVDTSIVRGLAYYSGIVFELFDAGRSLRAICGGGRYDGLLKALGDIDLPGVGFGMGDVVLGELLKERTPHAVESWRLDAYLVPVTIEDVPTVLRLAHALRNAGLRIEFSLKEQAISRQLKIAASRPAKRVVVIGPDERKQGEVVLRDMSTGTEQRVALSRLVEHLAGAK